jgi:hypothetical protein
MPRCNVTGLCYFTDRRRLTMYAERSFFIKRIEEEEGGWGGSSPMGKTELVLSFGLKPEI